MGELRRQAANVIATSPGEVIAYEGSPLTRASLEAAGISVRTFLFCAPHERLKMSSIIFNSLAI
jgi:hypothetical protein